MNEYSNSAPAHCVPRYDMVNTRSSLAPHLNTRLAPVQSYAQRESSVRDDAWFVPRLQGTPPAMHIDAAGWVFRLARGGPMRVDLGSDRCLAHMFDGHCGGGDCGGGGGGRSGWGVGVDVVHCIHHLPVIAARMRAPSPMGGGGCAYISGSISVLYRAP